METFIAVAIAGLILSCGAFVWILESRGKPFLSMGVQFQIYLVFAILPGYLYHFLGGLELVAPLLVLLTCSVSFFIGFSVGNLLLSRYPLAIVYKSRPFQEDNEKALFTAITVFSLLLVAPSLYLHQGFPPVITGVLQVLFGSGDLSSLNDQTGAYRKFITKGHLFGGEYRAQGIIRSLNAVVWPFVVILTLSSWAVFRTRKWSVMLVVVFVLSYIFISADGTRGPFINMLFLVLAASTFLFTIRLRHIFGAIILLCGVFIFLSIVSPKLGSSVGTEGFIRLAFESFFERVALGNSTNDVYAIDLINRGVIDYRLGGLHLHSIVAAIPGVGSGIPFSHELYQIRNPGAIGTTYSSGTYVTTLFVDFGVLGVGVGMLVIGFGMSLFQQAGFRVRKSIPGFALVLSSITSVSRVILIGLVGVGVSVALLAVAYLLFYFIYKALRNRNDFGYQTLGHQLKAEN